MHPDVDALRPAAGRRRSLSLHTHEQAGAVRADTDHLSGVWVIVYLFR